MGNLIKCPQGHYYDESQSTRCPFCGVGRIDVDTTVKADGPSDYSTTVKQKPSTSAFNNDGNTIAYDLRNKPGQAQHIDPEVTRAVWAQKIGIDPVVGWLVCHEGANKGRDYRIRAGWNSIGRDTSMHVCIAGDDTISREDHAKIFFDPKTLVFHLTTGNGRSGVYLNGTAVLQPTTLAPYDQVEIGSTKLTFIPFCCDKFTWDPM